MGGPMGCNGGESLWERLDHEVQRLTSERTKGKHFSEDFVVDRVCTLLARLRQSHDQEAAERQQDEASTSKQHSQELASLRANVAAEELKLEVQRVEIEKARASVQEAKRFRAELDQDWETEREQQRLASDKHARTWKETALRSQLCQARLKAMEQEGLQLRAALVQPEKLNKSWDSLITKLQAELDVANIEAAEAKREHDRLLAESSQADRRAAVEVEAGQVEVPTRDASSAAAPPLAVALPQPTLSSTQPALSTTSTAASRGTGPATSHATAGAARPLEGILRLGKLQSPTAQLSAAGSTAEAPYSTTSILNDARRALEKLEQLKVRRTGTTASPSPSFTSAVPTGPMRSAASPMGMQSAPEGMHSQGGQAASSQAPSRAPRPLTVNPSAGAATAFSPAPRVAPTTPQRVPPAAATQRGHSPSPQPPAQPQIAGQMTQRVMAQPPSPQPLAQGPSVRRPPPSPLPLKQQQQQQQQQPQQQQQLSTASAPPGASRSAAPPKAAMALRPQAQTSPGAALRPMSQRPVPSPARQQLSAGAAQIASPSSSVPPTPDLASRMFSRGAPKQAVPATLSAVAGQRKPGVPQDYGVMRAQQLRSS